MASADALPVSAPPSGICLWCQRPFPARRGGSPKRFCSAAHRTAFWSALRRWGEKAVATGMLTMGDIRNGDPAACTLLSGGSSHGQVSEPRLPAAVAPAARTGEAIVSLALDHMTAMQVRELTWGNPYHQATPEELAAAVVSLLTRACQALIMIPRR